MGSGEVLVFKVRYPWGLTHKIYAMMKKWYIEKYYDVRVNMRKGTVMVRKENTNYNFVYDDDYS